MEMTLERDPIDESSPVRRPQDTAAINAAARIAQAVQGQALRVAICDDLDALCSDPNAKCAGCSTAERCERKLTGLLDRLLGTAIEHVREESVLINQYRHDPRHAQELAMHVAAHDRLINDLSCHVMDCGRIAARDVAKATVALLKGWNETHFRFHDEALFELAVRPGL